MSRRIWKFPTTVTAVDRVEMPRGAKLLHVGVQGQTIVNVWAEVDLDEPFTTRRLAHVTTGAEPPDTPYVGTYHLVDGGFVGHIYDMGEEAHDG